MNQTICFCNTSRAWGGGEHWHLDAALGMAQRGCEVYLMANPSSLLFERASAHPQLKLVPQSFANLDFLNPCTLARLAAFFRKKKIARLVLGLTTDLKAAGIAAKMAGVPGIIYRRGSALPVRNSFFNRYLYGKILTGLIVNSEETGRLIFANNDSLIDKRKVHILYNGINIPAFDVMLAEAEPVFRQVGEQLVIGNAGRLTTQKGQHYLLHMSRKLLDAGIPHRVLLAGEGERREGLEALAERLNLGDCLEFLGFQDGMGPFWRSLDIFVLTSLWEGFGYVLAEAQLAGLPVIAFDGNSMPELVQNGENGILVDYPDPDERASAVGARLAAAVRSLMDNPTQTRAYAQAGRLFCEATFDQEKCMDALYSLLWGATAPNAAEANDDGKLQA